MPNFNLSYWQEKKVLWAGLPKSGKSWGCREVSRFFKPLVYTAHYVKGDRDYNLWNRENVIVPTGFNFVKDFPFMCTLVKRLAQQGIIDLFIIDDADNLFKHHFDTCTQLQDLMINHTHWGLTIFLVTRRPQSLPTDVYGQCEILALFSIESPQAIKLMNQYYEGLGDRVKELKYGAHDCWIKHVGSPPVKARF